MGLKAWRGAPAGDGRAREKPSRSLQAYSKKGVGSDPFWPPLFYFKGVKSWSVASSLC